MRKHYLNIFLPIGFIIIIMSCNNHDNKSYFEISDFVTKNDSSDTTQYLTWERFLSKFDTIPVDFGYKLFEDIISPIPIDSSIFKKTWLWSIDTIKTVLACKTNYRLDKNKLLSEETYFLIIYFESSDSITIAGTFYIDFKHEMIGTFVLETDEVNFDIIKIVRLKDDKYFVPDLDKKLTITKR